MSTKSGWGPNKITYPRLKLTPKGKRFADVVRRELARPDSYVSLAVRNLKGWQHQVKQHPREFRFILDGVIYKTVGVVPIKREVYDAIRMGYFVDMSIYYHACGTLAEKYKNKKV